jgi:hypothetical protein
MVKITISREAFAAIAASLPPESIAVEPETNEGVERHIWLPRQEASSPRPLF